MTHAEELGFWTAAGGRGGDRPPAATVRGGTSGDTRSSPRLLGVVDLGSNTFHLTVAHVEGGVRITPLVERKERVRLSGALARGSLDAEALAIADGALRRLMGIARSLPRADVVGVATSAIRGAANGAEFVEAARREHGLRIEVLQGDEEARLAWAGARSELPDLDGTVVVVDLGGGSLEVAAGRGDGCALAESLPLGVLRLSSRHACAGGVLDRGGCRRVEEDVRGAAAPVASAVRTLRPTRLVLTAGTARAIARALGAVGSEIRLPALHSLRRALVGRPPEALSALGVEPGRRETFVAGVITVSVVMELLGFDAARVCSRGLREGVLLREADRRGNRPGG